ncbi:MAG: von Willebrand factor type A domain-containing protein [Candidatus Kapaibacterium sp.]
MMKLFSFRSTLFLFAALLLSLSLIVIGCADGTPGTQSMAISSAQSESAPNQFAALSEASDEEVYPGEGVAEESKSYSANYADEPIYENPFRSVSSSPLSTFSIDVDAASYSNVRGYLNRGEAPPPAAVRVEELVNYFSYDYPEPTGEHPFAFNTEVADCPWNPEHRLVRVALQGKDVAANQMPPSNLVFLIDVSGSMDSEDKLPLLKQSFHGLIDRLRPEDRVAIVAYAGQAGMVLPSTSGADKGAIRKAIDVLESGGSTAGGAGISMAYKIAKKYYQEGGNNRVILATDGDFNVGVSDDNELVKLIESKRDEGIFLSVLGFGTGNYQDRKMEGIADNGNGNYYYIDNIREGKRVLVSELSSTLYTIAKDVKLQIIFNPAKVQAYRLVGYENRVLAAQDFDNDAKDAGELGAGHSVTAFYEVVPVGGEVGYEVDHSKAEDYQDAGKENVSFAREDLMAARLRYKQPNASVSKLIEHRVADNHLPIALTRGEFKFATAVAEWGMLLRGSSYSGSASFSQVAQLARAGLGNDEDGYRFEFLTLVERSASMRGERITSDVKVNGGGAGLR